MQGVHVMTDFVYVEAPSRPDLPAGIRKLFVGGAIPGSTDWQALVTRQVQASGQRVALFNPRRADFPVGDPAAQAEQVAWEHEHLHAADVSMFWFPAMPVGSQPAPTTIAELFEAIGEGRPLAVGASPWFPRREILEDQLALHPHVDLHRSLDDTVAHALRLLEDVPPPAVSPWLTRQLSSGRAFYVGPDAYRQLSLWTGDPACPDKVATKDQLDWMDGVLWPLITTALAPTHLDGEQT
jgi:hypothetical protein